MSDESDRRPVDRRSFLSAVGAAGASAALANTGAARVSAVATADDAPEAIRKAGAGAVLLVGVSAAGSLSAVAEAVPAPATVLGRNETLRFLRVDLSGTDGERERLAVQSAIAGHPDVKYTEPERLYTTAAADLPEEAATNEPRAAGYTDQYAPEQVRADRVPASGPGDPTVAVIDSGVDYEHDDLAGQFGADPGRDFTLTSGTDPAPAHDDEDHGTHVAGIVAADGRVEGMADADLVACRVFERVEVEVLGEASFGRAGAVADAITYAVDERDADVINMSLSFPWLSDELTDVSGSGMTMRQAVEYAADNGALPVAAAGNTGRTGENVPAAHDPVMAVGALDQYEDRAGFSTYGDWVDVFAPGMFVNATVPGGGYDRKPGTSMAAPVVAGVAALVKEHHPDLGVERLRTRLERGAVSVGNDPGEQGAGRVDAVRAVLDDDTTLSDPGEEPTTDIVASTREPYVGEEVVFRADPQATSGYVQRYDWEFDDSVHSRAGGERVTKRFDEPGEYEAQLVVTNDRRAYATVTETVEVQPRRLQQRVNRETHEGNLSGGSSDTYRYRVDSDEPTRLEVEVENAEGDHFGSDYVDLNDLTDAVERVSVVPDMDAEPHGVGPGNYHSRSDTPPDPLDTDDHEIELDTARLRWMDTDDAVRITVDGRSIPGVDATHNYELTIEEYATRANRRPRLEGRLVDRLGIHAGDDHLTPPGVTEPGDILDSVTGPTPTYHAAVGEPIELVGRAHEPDGEDVRFRWLIDGEVTRQDADVVEERWLVVDGHVVENTVERTFETAGEYEVTLIAYDERDNRNQTTATVQVHPNEPPVAAIDAPDRAAPGESVTFDATPSTDPDGGFGGAASSAALEYEWAFGDGTTPDTAPWSNPRQVSRAFDDPGEYEVTLTVTDGDGAVDTTTATVVVEEPTNDTTSSGDGPGATFRGEVEGGQMAYHTYTVPEAATSVAVELAADTDLDLYVTLDGAPPTRADADRRSRSLTGSERIVVDETVSEIGIGVTGMFDGRYTVSAVPECPSGCESSSDPADCGETTVEESMRGRLPVGGSDRYEYDTRLANPCRLAVSLDGPATADLDLYLGRGARPAVDDADRRSAGPDSSERITVGDPDAGETVELLVTAHAGAGSYDLTVTEVGTDGAAGNDGSWLDDVLDGWDDLGDEDDTDTGETTGGDGDETGGGWFDDGGDGRRPDAGDDWDDLTGDDGDDSDDGTDGAGDAGGDGTAADDDNDGGWFDWGDGDGSGDDDGGSRDGNDTGDASDGDGSDGDTDDGGWFDWGGDDGGSDDQADDDTGGSDGDEDDDGLLGGVGDAVDAVVDTVDDLL